MSKRVCFDLWHIICTNLNTKTGHICKKRIMHIKILHLKNSILTTKKCSVALKITLVTATHMFLQKSFIYIVLGLVYKLAAPNDAGAGIDPAC